MVYYTQRLVKKTVKISIPYPMFIPVFEIYLVSETKNNFYLS